MSGVQLWKVYLNVVYIDRKRRLQMIATSQKKEPQVRLYPSSAENPFSYLKPWMRASS